MEQPIFMYNPCFRDHRGTFAPQPLIFGESKREELRKKWIQSNVGLVKLKRLNLIMNFTYQKDLLTGL